MSHHRPGISYIELEGNVFRNYVSFATLLFAIAVVTSCSDRSALPTNSQVIVDPMANLSPSQERLLQASNTFGFTLFHQVNSSAYPDSNIFISPLSVSYALGMTYNGASGATREAIGRTLEMSGMTTEDFNASYQSLTKLLCGLDEHVAFEIANSIWYRLGFPVKPSFIELNRVFFDALVRDLDFELSTSADTINGWVSDKTHGRIDNVIDPPIDPSVVMFLINAIYFKGDWTVPFDSTSTRAGEFQLRDGGHVACQMMATDTVFRYTEDNLLQAVELSYGNKDFAMGILLPKADVTLDQVIDALTLDYWRALRLDLTEQRVMITLPKLKFGYAVKLNDALIAMGMGVAFDPKQADFDNITETVDLYISKVLHKSFLQIDEKGTEAAAVTVVVIEITAVPCPMVTVDHPFLFVIYEKVSGTILFMGKVVTPTWEE